MSDYTPASYQNLDIEVDEFLLSNKLKDYAPGNGGKMFQLPKRNNILKRSRDLRISPRDAAIDYASQQVRHVRYCRDKNCGYQWCSVVKSLLDHWKGCKDRRNMAKCYKCDSLRVLFLRAQGKFVAPPPRTNRNINANNNNNHNNRNNRNAANNRGPLNNRRNTNVNTNLNLNINTNATVDILPQDVPLPPINTTTQPTATFSEERFSQSDRLLPPAPTNTETDVHT